MAGFKASFCFIAALLLILAPAFAEEDYGADDTYDTDGGMDGYGDDYGDPYGGYGDDYGGMGGAGGSDLSSPIKGVLDLDKFTFPKIVGGGFPVAVMFFDAESAMDLQEEFEPLAENMAQHPDLILAKVDGDDEEELVKKFSIESFPSLMFFAKGSTEPKVYDGEMTEEGMEDFLVEFVGEIGQLKELMPLVSKFLSNKAARASTVKETEEAASSLSDTAAVFGKWYVKIMNNIMKKGDEYPTAEFSRLLRMVYDESDSLKEEKLAEFRQRLTVLKVFNPDLKELEKQKREEQKSVDEVEVDDKDVL